MIYGIVSIISVLIRQFVLPNPFECFGEKAFLINLIAEPIIQIIAYLLVGLVYQKESNHLFGSILFLLTFSLIVGVLWILGIFKFVWWWILILLISFIGIVVTIHWLINKLDEKYYD